MIIGDLNEFFNSYEKLANHNGNSIGYNKFKKILKENNLVDIGYIGFQYTWWNNRTHKRCGL